ncbi:hypothetical protein N4R57_07125 [Rhodobacteraceae bacterium D3-12]|nr:hypothetical protein N4R57_07125 [Rhodobacteraceae bacterium D3-12]
MTKPLPLLTLLVAVGFALSPFLSSGFNGFEAGQFPIPQDDPPVQPAGYAFSIWGLIYLWLIVGAAIGLVKHPASPDWQAMRPALILSLGSGIFWLAIAQVSVPWATALIFFMLATALAALLRAGNDERLWLREPIGLYAGWLTAASSVSVGLMLAGYGVTGATTAALLALALALTITVSIHLLRPNSAAYLGGVLWALIGVIVANSAPMNTPVLTLASLGAVLTAGLTLRALRS